MKRLSLSIFMILVSLTQMAPLAFAKVPPTKVKDEMDKFMTPFLKKSGWNEFLKKHTSQNDSSFVRAEEYPVEIDGEKAIVGLGFRSVHISAKPQTVVAIVNDPKYFQSLYGLDKPANISTVKADGTFDARIFKIVPGVENQDFTLNYQGHWEGPSWIGQAKMVKDEKNFALRNNIKMVEPQGDGSVYREIALFYPLRWWLKLFPGTVQKITKTEMAKLNKTIKCASEKVSRGEEMSDEIGKTCFTEASK